MPEMAKPPMVVFDIDGTVSDYRHRRHHLASDPPDWEAFFSSSDLDAPLPQGVTLAQEHADRSLIWLTGRPERYRRTTAAWLERYSLPAGILCMRSDDDVRPAPVFKAERLDQLGSEYEIVLVVDDDDLVVDAVRDAGWPVLHARWMPR